MKQFVPGLFFRTAQESGLDCVVTALLFRYKDFSVSSVPYQSVLTISEDFRYTDGVSQVSFSLSVWSSCSGKLSWALWRYEASKKCLWGHLKAAPKISSHQAEPPRRRVALCYYEAQEIFPAQLNGFCMPKTLSECLLEVSMQWAFQFQKCHVRKFYPPVGRKFH